MLYIPECVNPLLLVNRAAINMIFYGGELYMFNNRNNLINRYNINDYSITSLLNVMRGKDDSVLETCFVLYKGHKEHLFFYAPCGHCLLCSERKTNEFVARCQMESQLYDCPPYFFTLTYEDKYLFTPLNPRGDLCYKHFQDFLKRLRSKWDYMNLPNSVRYVVAGEYGSRTHRAHFHVILWNNPYNANELTPKTHFQLYNDILSAWGMCIPQAFQFGQCGDGAAGYVAKYLRKEPKLYGHLVKPFLHASVRNGGIGSGLIKQKIDYYRENPTSREFRYIDKLSNQLKTQLFGQYITHIIWPSPTRLVPANLRDSYKEFSEIAMWLSLLDGLSLSDVRTYIELVRPYKSVTPNRFSMSFINQHKNFLIFGFHKTLMISRYCRVLNTLGDILCEVNDIEPSYLDKYYNYKELNAVERKREDFASKLIKIRQKREIAKERESF